MICLHVLSVLKDHPRKKAFTSQSLALTPNCILSTGSFPERDPVKKLQKNHQSEMHGINYYNVANLKCSKNCLHAQLQPQAYSRNILYTYDHLILYIW